MTSPAPHHATPRSGFSLVEMAVVLVIVAILLGGILPTVSNQMNQQRMSETRKQLDEIRSSLVGFAVANGRLPCPDTNNDGNEDISATTVTSNDIPQVGQSTKKTSCSATTGNLPYVQLGSNATDSYGAAFVYAVTPAFSEKKEIYSANNAGGTLLYSSYFNLSSLGTLNVCSSTNNASTTPCPSPRLTDTNTSSGAAAVVLSRGADWAQTPDIEETENTDNDTDFISHEPNATFDDIVVWLSPSPLFNRMVAAGKLP